HSDLWCRPHQPAGLVAVSTQPGDVVGRAESPTAVLLQLGKPAETQAHGGSPRECGIARPARVAAHPPSARPAVSGTGRRWDSRPLRIPGVWRRAATWAFQPTLVHVPKAYVAKFTSSYLSLPSLVSSIAV